LISRTLISLPPFSRQYAHIIPITLQVLSLALISILLVTSLLLGSWRTGAVVTLVCALAVFDVMGVMGVWDISLNAISLVNLVISLGIAVEFCSHVARAFMGAGDGAGGLAWSHPLAKKDRDERAWSALVDVGASVSRSSGVFVFLRFLHRAWRMKLTGSSCIRDRSSLASP
jgi:Niemann-Pick C1 protein